MHDAGSDITYIYTYNMLGVSCARCWCIRSMMLSEWQESARTYLYARACVRVLPRGILNAYRRELMPPPFPPVSLGLRPLSNISNPFHFGTQVLIVVTMTYRSGSAAGAISKEEELTFAG